MTQKLPSNASMSRWPRLNHLASLTSVVETVPEKKPQKRLTVDSWQCLPPFFPVSFWRNLPHSPFRSGATASSMPGLSRLPTRPPTVLGPLACWSTVLTQIPSVSQGASCLPLNSWGPWAAVPEAHLEHALPRCPSPHRGCVLLTPRSWSPNLLEQQLHAARSSPWMPGKLGKPPTQREMPLSIPNLCPLPCSLSRGLLPLPPHLSVQKILIDILLILPWKQRGSLLCSVSFPLLPLTQDDQEKPGH